MIYNILFAVCGIGLIAMGLRMGKLYTLFESWKVEVLRLIGLTNDLDNKRFEDSCQLAIALKRIQVLEERLEGQEAFTSNLENRLEAHAAELTEHHNKIDTLEINGSIYEGLFEQQGLWGSEQEDPNV